MTASTWTIWSASRARSVRNRTAIGFVLAMLHPAGPVQAQSMPTFGTVPPDTTRFAYDREAPLEVEVGKTAERDGYRRAAVSWASPDGGRVPAWLYVPDAEAPYPAILMQHGMPGTRNSLHPLAEAYARAGALVLAPTAPFGRPDPLYREVALFTMPTFDEGDRLELEQTVKDLRRAVDLLVGRSDVDPSRIAYVGVSYGGWAGAVLSGVEDRIVAYGLMVGPTSLGERMVRDDDGIEMRTFRELDAPKRAAWLRSIAALDGRHFVARAAPARLRFDVGVRDELVPLPDALALASAASEPKVVERWEAGHPLVPEAYAAQARWLAPILGIDPERFVPPDFRKDGR